MTSGSQKPRWLPALSSSFSLSVVLALPAFFLVYTRRKRRRVFLYIRYDGAMCFLCGSWGLSGSLPEHDVVSATVAVVAAVAAVATVAAVSLLFFYNFPSIFCVCFVTENDNFPNYFIAGCFVFSCSINELCRNDRPCDRLLYEKNVQLYHPAARNSCHFNSITYYSCGKIDGIVEDRLRPVCLNNTPASLFQRNAAYSNGNL